MKMKRLIESLERLTERGGYGGGPEMEYDPTDYDGPHDDRYDAPPDDYDDGGNAEGSWMARVVADTAKVAPSVRIIGGTGFTDDVYTEPRVLDRAKVLGRVKLQGDVVIKDRAVVKDRAVIVSMGDVVGPRIGGSAVIAGDTVVNGNIAIMGGTWDFPAEDPVIPLQRGRNVFKSAESYIEARDRIRQQMRADAATPFEVKRRKELRRRLKAKGLLRP